MTEEKKLSVAIASLQNIWAEGQYKDFAGIIAQEALELTGYLPVDAVKITTEEVMAKGRVENETQEQRMYRYFHGILDKLAAAWIGETKKPPSQGTILELMEFASKKAQGL